jgi:hypothetical protein
MATIFDSSIVRSEVRVEGSGVGALGAGTTNTAIRRFLTTVINTGADITYTDSATLGGAFTINTAGLYFVSYSDRASTGTGNPLGISQNSTQLTTSINGITSVNRITETTVGSATNSAQCSALVFCSVNDVLRAHGDGAGAMDFTGVSVCFSITKVGN